MLKHPQLILDNNAAVNAITKESKIMELPKTDVANSPYYKPLDVYNMQSTGSRVMLTHFETRQQHTEYTCGPVAAQMVLDYYHSNGVLDEITIGKIMGTDSIKGTDVAGMAQFFKKMSWKVTDSRDTSAPATYEEFIKWVKNNLNEGTPIIVENVDWGGHWRVIIGFDDMGTDVGDDDVLILADPYDSTDHVRDGYNVSSAARFYYMWFDHQLFPSGQQDRIYLIAKPK